MSNFTLSIAERSQIDPQCKYPDVEEDAQKAPLIVRYFDGLVVETIDPTTILLDWTPCCQHMTLKGYMVRCNITNNSICKEIFVPPGITSYTLTGLEPSTDYILCIDAVDQHHQIICSSGNMTQTTDPVFKEKRRHAVPYIAAITAICLLIAAAMVPLFFLFRYV
ncbi:hypothetical protein ACJMK2_043180 [Sinanodonta woodiana]|uniref:Fibronectin type-III domain-containing protein n=1 Tax=Sinanodonta woodiana TaxID=1069815 RepID=A0ABD3VWX0_SINWO